MRLPVAHHLPARRRRRGRSTENAATTHGRSEGDMGDGTCLQQRLRAT